MTMEALSSPKVCTGCIAAMSLTGMMRMSPISSRPNSMSALASAPARNSNHDSSSSAT